MQANVMPITAQRPIGPWRKHGRISSSTLIPPPKSHRQKLSVVPSAPRSSFSVTRLTSYCRCCALSCPYHIARTKFPRLSVITTKMSDPSKLHHCCNPAARWCLRCVFPLPAVPAIPHTPLAESPEKLRVDPAIRVACCFSDPCLAEMCSQLAKLTVLPWSAPSGQLAPRLGCPRNFYGVRFQRMPFRENASLRLPSRSHQIVAFAECLIGTGRPQG